MLPFAYTEITQNHKDTHTQKTDTRRSGKQYITCMSVRTIIMLTHRTHTQTQSHNEGESTVRYSNVTESCYIITLTSGSRVFPSSISNSTCTIRSDSGCILNIFS